jgi:aldehyde dehydrogenase (NAD+)
MDIGSICKAQQVYFGKGETHSVDFRIAQLKKLQTALREQEEALSAALKADLGKSSFESYMCEVGMVLEELDYMLRHVRRFARAKSVPTPLSQGIAKSFVLAKPYGSVLIMSPWNYPLLLTLGPLVDALAAGNTAVVKPSAYSPNVSQAIAKLLGGLFPPEYVAVVEGGRNENTALLEEKFDYIFFTGSKAVGRLVMEKAARHLTPVTLELGGKSPCIVDETANIAWAARRIVFGKYLNCGQTCVAPDYVLVQESVHDALVEAIKKEIALQFGENPLNNSDYGKIINEKHFNRLCGLLKDEPCVYGGEVNREQLRIAPAVIDHATMDSAAMQEEIFGPILPVLTIKDISDVPSIVSQHPTPLALYLFTENQAHERYIMNSISFGGGCVNDTIIHLATTHMGFGGVGESGMGSYHGKHGFDTFTHYTSIVKQGICGNLPFRYQPYTDWKLRIVHRFMH